MATISHHNIALAIYLVLKDKNEKEQTLIFPKIIKFLIRNRLLKKAPDILSHLSKIINEEENRVVAKVLSRDNLSEKTKHELKNVLTKKYMAKEVDLILNTDKKLLGGFKIEVNDEVTDLTLKNRIKKLKEHLKDSI